MAKLIELIKEPKPNYTVCSPNNSNGTKLFPVYYKGEVAMAWFVHSEEAHEWTAQKNGAVSSSLDYIKKEIERIVRYYKALANKSNYSAECVSRDILNIEIPS